MRTVQELPGTTLSFDTKIICPLCSRTGSHVKHVLDHHEIRRCGKCGFVFAWGEPEVSYEAGYYESLGGYERFLAAKVPEWRALYRGLARRTEGRKLLEVGCARGYALALAREVGWLPHGVEVSGDDAMFARSKFGLKVHHGTVQSCPFEEGSFDVVTMWSVIEHMTDPATALEACSRLLKPGGLLSIHTCNVDSSVAWEARRDWSMYHLPGHVSFFSPATMRDALDRTGFEAEELKTALGSRPVNVDPNARSRPSLRKVVAGIASTLRLKEPLREFICILRPYLRDQGEFMAVIARKV